MCRRLVAVHSGRCEITVTLAVQGTDLILGHAHLELPGVLPIRQSIRLLPVGEYATGDDLMRKDTASELGGTGPD